MSTQAFLQSGKYRVPRIVLYCRERTWPRIIGHIAMTTQLSPKILEQAADWFVKFRTVIVPVSEREEFFRWLQQSPQHVQAYLEEALTCSDVVPLTMCDRLTERIDKPCSATRSPDDARR